MRACISFNFFLLRERNMIYSLPEKCSEQLSGILRHVTVTNSIPSQAWCGEEQEESASQVPQRAMNTMVAFRDYLRDITISVCIKEFPFCMWERRRESLYILRAKGGKLKGKISRELGLLRISPSLSPSGIHTILHQNVHVWFWTQLLWFVNYDLQFTLHMNYIN